MVCFSHRKVVLIFETFGNYKTVWFYNSKKPGRFIQRGASDTMRHHSYSVLEYIYLQYAAYIYLQYQEYIYLQYLEYIYLQSAAQTTF